MRLLCGGHPLAVDRLMPLLLSDLVSEGLELVLQAVLILVLLIELQPRLDSLLLTQLAARGPLRLGGTLFVH